MSKDSSFPPQYKFSNNPPPEVPKTEGKLKSIIAFSVLVLIFITSSIGYGYYTFFYKKPASETITATSNNGDSTSKSSNKAGSSMAELVLSEQEELKSFESIEELRTFLGQRSSYSSHFGFGNMAARFSQPANGNIALGAPVAESGFGGGGAGDYSQTNVQVDSIDEADMVKTDGKYIYTISHNTVQIVNAFPAESARIESTIKLSEDNAPQRLFVKDNILVIFGEETSSYLNDTQYSTIIDRYARLPYYQYVKIFDISDKNNPVLVRDLEFEGNYMEARLHGDYVYLATKTYGDLFYTHPYPLPIVRENGNVIEELNGIENVHYIDIPFSYYQYVSIAAINLKSNAEPITREVVLTNNADNFYMSENAIYLTNTKYLSEDILVTDVLRDLVYSKLNQSDQELILEIEQTPDRILSREEKLEKIQVLLDRYSYNLTIEEKKKLEKEVQDSLKRKYQEIEKELERTVVHKININNNEITYNQSNSVPGHILNQFSMDEYDGYFRIATTLSEQWSRFREDPAESYSNLYVLDSDLNNIGALEKLAPGERIYSARFMNDRAFLVTFKQVDPLFAIDLSNPANPTIAGSLKIPGFSNYLHPYDENHLIGIGYSTKLEDGDFITQQGLKISLFDVTDLSNPIEQDSIVIGDRGTASLATSDHKAVLFSKEKGLLVIPATIREFNSPSDYWGKLTFDGALVLAITDQEITERGRIDHTDGFKDEEYFYVGGNSFQEASVPRSLYLENDLYTVSQSYIKINDLTSLEAIQSIEMGLPKIPDFEIINNLPSEDIIEIPTGEGF